MDYILGKKYAEEGSRLMALGLAELITVDVKPPPRGGQRIQKPKRGTFRRETNGCGCVYFHYRQQILEVKGCEIGSGEHESRVVKVCGVNGCNREFTRLKDYKEHRSVHSY